MALPRYLITNFFLLGTVSATDTASGYNVNNIADWRSFTKWKAANNSGVKNVAVQMSSSLEGNCIGIFGHNFGSTGTEFKVQYYDTGSSDWEDASNTFSPASDNTIFVFFGGGLFSTDWRIRITSGSAAAEIGVAMLGKYVEIPVPPDAPLIPFAENSELQAPLSEDANTLGVIHKNKTITLTPVFRNFVKSFYDDSLLPAWNVHWSLGYPFFYAEDATNAATNVFFVRWRPSEPFQHSKVVSGYVEEFQFPLVGRR